MPQSATPANECEGLGRACTAAARELKAARALLKGYEEEIAAHESRLDLAKKEIEKLKEIGALETERAKNLEGLIAAHVEQIRILLKQKELYEKRVAQLDKQLKRSRKLALVFGVAAAVGIVIAVGK